MSKVNSPAIAHTRLWVMRNGRAAILNEGIMQVEVTVTIGDKQLRVVEDVSSQAQMFDRLEFWDSIPRTGPKGETDLKFVHRTPKGYDYYEIVCESAKMRFQFGQKQDDKGSLFPKGWAPLYGEGEQEGDEMDAPAPPPAIANPGQVKAINQIIEDIVRQNIKRESVIKKIQDVVGWECSIEGLSTEEAAQIITLLRNRLAEIKSQRAKEQREKQGVA